MVSGSVGASVGTAKAAAVRERVLDLPYTPSLLIQHLVIDDAGDGEFRILLNRIVLQIFITTVAIDKVAPRWIAVADAAAKRDCHGCRFNIEWLVILDESNCVACIQLRRVHRNGLEKEREIEPLKKKTCLRKIRPIAKIEHECLQPRGIHPQLAHHMVGRQEDAAAVDAA